MMWNRRRNAVPSQTPDGPQRARALGDTFPRRLWARSWVPSHIARAILSLGLALFLLIASSRQSGQNPLDQAALVAHANPREQITLSCFTMNVGIGRTRLHNESDTDLWVIYTISLLDPPGECEFYTGILLKGEASPDMWDAEAVWIRCDPTGSEMSASGSGCDKGWRPFKLGGCGVLTCDMTMRYGPGVVSILGSSQPNSQHPQWKPGWVTNPNDGRDAAWGAIAPADEPNGTPYHLDTSGWSCSDGCLLDRPGFALGAVRGLVTQGSAQPVSAASVTFNGGGVGRSVIANGLGEYVFYGVPAGNSRITASKLGFVDGHVDESIVTGYTIIADDIRLSPVTSPPPYLASHLSSRRHPRMLAEP
jgi:hypothetical protein